MHWTGSIIQCWSGESYTHAIFPLYNHLVLVRDRPYRFARKVSVLCLKMPEMFACYSLTFHYGQWVHRRMNHQSKKTQFSDNYRHTLYSHSAVLTVYAKLLCSERFTWLSMYKFTFCSLSGVKFNYIYDIFMFFLYYSFKHIYSSMHSIGAIIIFGGTDGIMIDYSTSKNINSTTVNNYIEMWMHWLRRTACCRQVSAIINRSMLSLKHSYDLYKLSD